MIYDLNIVFFQFAKCKRLPEGMSSIDPQNEPSLVETNLPPAGSSC